jgi:hypothetical protein
MRQGLLGRQGESEYPGDLVRRPLDSLLDRVRRPVSLLDSLLDRVRPLDQLLDHQLGRQRDSPLDSLLDREGYTEDRRSPIR